MPAELEFSELEKKDFAEAGALIRRGLGKEFADAEYLQWWCRDNPTGLTTIQIVREEGGAIGGIFAIQGFRFNISGRTVLGAMPADAVLSESLRGRRLFNDLYARTEAAALKQGAQWILTINNEISTHVFTARLGFAAAAQAEVVFVPSNPFCLLRKASYRVVVEPDRDLLGGPLLECEDAIVKDGAYLRWRYLSHGRKRYTIVEAAGGAGRRGVAFLKRVRKRGIPVYLLMDLCVREQGDVAEVMRQAVCFSSRNAAAGLLLFRRPELEPWLARTWHKSLGRRFNLLVKGRSAEETASLARVRFNLAFGDLDFL